MGEREGGIDRGRGEVKKFRKSHFTPIQATHRISNLFACVLLSHRSANTSNTHIHTHTHTHTHTYIQILYHTYCTCTHIHIPAIHISHHCTRAITYYYESGQVGETAYFMPPGIVLSTV